MADRPPGNSRHYKVILIFQLNIFTTGLKIAVRSTDQDRDRFEVHKRQAAKHCHHQDREEYDILPLAQPLPAESPVFAAIQLQDRSHRAESNRTRPVRPQGHSHGQQRRPKVDDELSTHAIMACNRLERVEAGEEIDRDSCRSCACARCYKPGQGTAAKPHIGQPGGPRFHCMAFCFSLWPILGTSRWVMAPVGQYSMHLLQVSQTSLCTRKPWSPGVRHRDRPSPGHVSAPLHRRPAHTNHTGCNLHFSYQPESWFFNAQLKQPCVGSPVHRDSERG